MNYDGTSACMTVSLQTFLHPRFMFPFNKRKYTWCNNSSAAFARSDEPFSVILKTIFLIVFGRYVYISTDAHTHAAKSRFFGSFRFHVIRASKKPKIMQATMSYD